jgi:hypothetical protein
LQIVYSGPFEKNAVELDPLTVLGILSGIASLSGYSMRDLVSIKRNQQVGLANTLARILAAFEPVDDELTGIWAVNKWDYAYELHSAFHVSGSLAVLYKDPAEQRWLGSLYLRYQKSISGRPILGSGGWLARQRGHRIDGAYAIEIRKSDARKYTGNSTQVYREPKRGIMDSGEFSYLQLNPDGKLIGEFRNTNTKGHADVAFHQRGRWRELPQLTSA